MVSMITWKIGQGSTVEDVTLNPSASKRGLRLVGNNNAHKLEGTENQASYTQCILMLHEQME